MSGKHDWEMDHGELWALYLKVHSRLSDALDLLIEVPLGAVHADVRDEFAERRRKLFADVLAIERDIEPREAETQLKARTSEVEAAWESRPPAT